MEAEEGDGAREGAGEGAGHVEAEEQLHFLVLPRQEGLGEAGMQAGEAWGSPVWGSLTRLVLEVWVPPLEKYASV